MDVCAAGRLLDRKVMYLKSGGGRTGRGIGSVASESGAHLDRGQFQSFDKEFRIIDNRWINSSACVPRNHGASLANPIE